MEEKLKEEIEKLKGQIEGIDERLRKVEQCVIKLTDITITLGNERISKNQWEHLGKPVYVWGDN